MLNIEKGVPLVANEYVETALKMEPGDSVLFGPADAGKKAALKLARAIESAHGARTSTVKMRADGFRVWRIQERPYRPRKKATE